jgi:glutathione synthase
MMLEAQVRGHALFYCTAGNLSFSEGQALANCQPIQVHDNTTNFYTLGETKSYVLSDFNIILMRKDPPFDSDYLYATHLLDHAKAAGVQVVNNPQALRDVNEKLFILQFPQCIAPTLVSSNESDIRSFWAEQNDIILKPLHGMGGAGIFRLQPNDPNAGAIIETLTGNGKHIMMAQRYLPEIAQGDKRILLIDGKPAPYCLARLPKAGETRANLAAGGTGVAQPLSERDLWICEQVSERLKNMGLRFVGLDVIGDYLTEVNVTSPTCIREIDVQCKINIAGLLFDALEVSLT